MKTRIALLISLIFLIWFGCKKDEGPSVEQNKQTLDELVNVIGADLNELSDSEGVKAINTLMDLFELDDPIGDIFKSQAVSNEDASPPATVPTTFMKQIRSGLKSVVSSAGGGNGFDNLTGTYTWESSVMRWSVKAGDPPDRIIINFPTEGSSENNAVLTISDFEEEMFVDDWGYGFLDTTYQPTKIVADLVVNDTRYIDLSFASSWSDSGIPASLNASLTIKPVTLSLNFSDNGALISVDASLSINESVAMSVNLEVEYTVETQEWGSVEVVSGISGFIHYATVKLAGGIDIEALENIEQEPTLEEINQYINLALYNYGDGSKIADIKITEGTEDIEIQLVFTDGSIEPADKYLGPVLDKIEEQMGELPDIFDLDM